MGKSQRTKGAAGERELLALIKKALADRGIELDLCRNLEQTREGGADCIGIPGIALEAKRQECRQYAAWWRQALEQADSARVAPVLGYRHNRKPWVILVPRELAEAGYPIRTFQKRTGLPAASEMTISEFASWYESWRRRIAPTAPRPVPVCHNGYALE
ncbi:MAG: putative PDDEXK endonuclease [Prochlorothrix sp.]|jgi:hypothetical protein